MTVFGEHSVHRLLTLAKESAELMWHAHDFHLAADRSVPGWAERAWNLFQCCVEADARVEHLRRLAEIIPDVPSEEIASASV